MKWVKNKQFWGALIGVALLVFCLRDLNFEDISQLWYRIDFIYFGPAVGCGFLFIILRGLRWKIILNQKTKVKTGRSILLYSAGQVLNIVMPALTGQVGRLILFARKEGLRKTFVFSTIILEIVFDAVSLILFILVTSLVAAFPEEYRDISYIVAGATLVAVIFLYLILQFREQLEDLGYRRLRDRSPGAYITIKKFLRSFTKGIELLKSSQHVVLTMILSLGSWTFHMLALYFLFLSFGFNESVPVAAAIMIINTIILMIPITPGNAGTFEIAVSRALLLLSTTGIVRSDAVLYALALHILDLIPILVLGMTFLHVERMSLAQLKREHEDEIILDKIGEDGSYVEEEEQV
jgi:uncharacterized protein (TIRG00374 family)